MKLAPEKLLELETLALEQLDGEVVLAAKDLLTLTLEVNQYWHLMSRLAEFEQRNMAADMLLNLSSRGAPQVELDELETQTLQKIREFNGGIYARQIRVEGFAVSEVKSAINSLLNKGQLRRGEDLKVYPV